MLDNYEKEIPKIVRSFSARDGVYNFTTIDLSN